MTTEMVYVKDAHFSSITPMYSVDSLDSATYFCFSRRVITFQVLQCWSTQATERTASRVD